MLSAVSGGRCEGLGEANLVAPNIANTPLLARIAPSPAKAVVEHREGFASCEFANDSGIVGRSGAQRDRRRDKAAQRFGIMGGDHPARERDVGKILAIGIEFGVWRVGRSRKGELLSGGVRMLAFGR